MKSLAKRPLRTKNFAQTCAQKKSKLLCTVLNAQNFRQKSLKILLIFSPNFAKFDKFSLDFAQILPDFCRIFLIRPPRNVREMYADFTVTPEGPRSLHFRGKRPIPRLPELASSCARPSSAAGSAAVRKVGPPAPAVQEVGPPAPAARKLRRDPPAPDPLDPVAADPEEPKLTLRALTSLRNTRTT